MKRILRISLLILIVAAQGAASEIVDKNINHKWELIPQLSVISPSRFVLTNDDYSIPYSTLLSGLPAIYVSAATPIGKIYDAQVSALVRVGYSYKSGEYLLKARNGDEQKSNLTLSWLPVSVGMMSEYAIPGFPFIKPMLTIGAGAEWMRQTGTLPGLSADFWLPFFYVSPAIGFFEGAASIDWFGGFIFGVTYQDSILYEQKARAWSFDLSATILF